VSDVPYLYRLTVATEIDVCRERLAQGKISSRKDVSTTGFNAAAAILKPS
jgi:hypothetical protein